MKRSYEGKIIALWIAGFFALLITACAFAHDNDDHAPPPPPPPSSSTPATATASGGSASATGGNASATSEAGATADSRASSSSGSTAQSNNSITTTAQKIPVATAVAGLGETTAACRYHNGGGLQLLGVGVSVGHSSKDADCERLKLAEFLYSHGRDIAGDHVMCAITAIKQALGDECMALVNELKPAPKAEDGSTKYVTPAELDRAMKTAATK